MKALRLPIVLIVLEAQLLAAQTDNPVFPFPPSIQLTPAERGHLSSSSRNGNVFVVAGNVLYRLSSQLQQLQSVSVSPIVALTTTDDGEWLVACFTTRNCTAYNTSDLNTMDTPTENANLFPTGITSITLFTAPLAELPTIYIGSGDVLGSTRRFDLARLGFAGSTLVEEFESSSSTTMTRRMYGGFLYNTNAYFLALDSESVLPPTMYIIRVCNDDQLAARYELQLTCGGALSISSVITGVSEVNGALVVNVDGRVCSYSLETINMTLNEHFHTCLIQQSGGNSAQFVTGSGTVACSSITSGGSELCNFATTENRLVVNAGSSSGSVLINGGVNISLAISVEENSFLFVGTSNNVDKYLLTVGGGTTSLYSMSVSSAVTALSWSPAVDYVYATAGNQVVRLPLETCSSSVTCNSCVTNGDPLCGWCSVENKCSRRTQCQDNTGTRRYLAQGEQTSCTDTVVFDPPQFVSEIQSVPYQVNLTFSPASPPPLLSGEEFLCVFSNVERGITFNTTLNTQTMSCDLTSSLPPLTGIKLVTRFSVYSTRSGVTFFNVVNRYTFYNCSHGANCQGCVDTEGNCGWCVYDFSCTRQPLDCSVVDSFVTLNTDQSYTDVCPVLSPPNISVSGAYVQPVNVNSPINISGSNLPFENGFIQYMCVFGTISTPAQRVNSTVVMCDGQVSPFTGISGRENTTFQLMLINGSNVYTLDTSTGGNVFVVLYQCSDLATECSSCLAQRMGTDFQCGWCGSTCIDVSDTCSTPSSFVDVSRNCPAPMISSVSPDSGPTSGGTTVSITGTNLGTSFSDIISIRVGSLTCTSRVNSYMVGRRITCDIVNGSSSQTQAGNVAMVITVRRMGGADVSTTPVQFRFGIPRVYSVSPSFGPVAGGTMVRVRGEDLNIGNTERTTVSLVTTPVGSGRRRRRRQIMGSVSCNIMRLIAANEITCVWSNFSASMSGVVQVTVDSAVVQNETVTYQYLNNPVYVGLTPQQTIRAGGIRLTFIGQYLNVSQQPTLQFNIGPNAVNSTCQVDISGTSLKCLAPPLTELNDYTVVMDASPRPDNNAAFLSLMLVDDPMVTQIRQESRRVDLSVNSTITIEGEHINNVDREEITVMVGQDQCVIQTTGATIITCVAPQRSEPVMETVIVMFGLNINNTVGMLEYGSVSDSIAPIAGGVAGGVIMLLLIFILVILVPIIYCYYSSISKYKVELERVQQPVYRFVPEQPGITMTADVGYKSSAGLHETALNPAYTKSSEPDHLYEEFSEDLDREEKEALATDGGGDDYYVNGDLHPGHEENTEQHSVGATNGMRIKESKDEDAEYYVNDDLVPEHAKLQSRSENTVMKECKENDDYYANDDLFPEKVKKELHPDDQKKSSAKGSDCYVNDALVSENTKGKTQSAHAVQAKEKDKEHHSNHGDHSKNQLTDAEEEKEKEKEGSRRDDVDDDGYIPVEFKAPIIMTDNIAYHPCLTLASGLPSLSAAGSLSSPCHIYDEVIFADKELETLATCGERTSGDYDHLDPMPGKNIKEHSEPGAMSDTAKNGNDGAHDYDNIELLTVSAAVDEWLQPTEEADVRESTLDTAVSDTCSTADRTKNQSADMKVKERIQSKENNIRNTDDTLDEDG